MRFRRTTAEDLPAVLAIIRQAQEALKRQGVDQWQNGYPTEADIRRDIAGESAYVLELNGKIAGTAALWFAPEESYAHLKGRWNTDGAYAVVHRIAVDDAYKGQGLAAQMLAHFECLCREHGVASLRADTHAQNLSMRRMLQKYGCSECGVVYLNGGPETGDKRIAYEKVLASAGNERSACLAETEPQETEKFTRVSAKLVHGAQACELYLRRFEDRDLPLLKHWLQCAHVRRWFEHPGAWLDEVRQRTGRYCWIHHFIAVYQQRAVGFCQYYRYSQSGEDWQGNVPLEGTYSVDYLLGEPALLGRGLGRQMVQALIEAVGCEPDARRIIVQPDPENLRSCNTLRAAGFALDLQNRLYRLELSEGRRNGSGMGCAPV
ncbi:MAG: GNAT family N-acetyltransferase [Oscillospiraceae bacterium]